MRMANGQRFAQAPVDAAAALDDAVPLDNHAALVEDVAAANVPPTPALGSLAEVGAVSFANAEFAHCAPKQRLRGHSDSVLSVEAFDNDAGLFTAALDDCVRVWRPAGGAADTSGPWRCASVRIAPDSVTAARLGGGTATLGSLSCAVATLSGGCFVLDALDASRPAMALPAR